MKVGAGEARDQNKGQTAGSHSATRGRAKTGPGCAPPQGAFSSLVLPQPNLRVVTDPLRGETKAEGCRQVYFLSFLPYSQRGVSPRSPQGEIQGARMLLLREKGTAGAPHIRRRTNSPSLIQKSVGGRFPRATRHILPQPLGVVTV